MTVVCARCKEKPPRAEGQSYCRECHAAAEKARPKKARRWPRYAELTPAGKVRATAHVSAYVAVKLGKLVPVPCECGCGTPLNQLEKHHEDYSKPREVVWCCRSWHRVLDARRRERLKAEASEVYIPAEPPTLAAL